MNLSDNIEKLYTQTKSYPELVKGLIELGILSYTVEVATSTILYRLAEGKNILHENNSEPKEINKHFDKEKMIKALKDTQQGKTTYPQFMEDISNAGIRFYEATLHGSNKRVTYIGSGGYYEESIPL